MLRRPPFGIPRAEQVDMLVALLKGRDIEPPDPTAFQDSVVAHRVTGFADEAIESQRLRVPDRTARELQDAHAFATLRSALLRRELAEVAPLIAAASGSEPLVLKGPVVSETLYAPRTLRPFADLDLLVPRSGIEAASKALAGLGYRINLQLRPGFSERYGHHVNLKRSQGGRGLSIDLHWRVSDDPLAEQLDYERIEQARVCIDGADLACPSPAEQLIVLATHFLADRQRRLLWIEDLRRAALAADDAQWKLAFERADDRGLSWVLNRALDYATHHLGLDRVRPLPPGPRPRWGPLRAAEALDVGISWDIGHLTSIPWSERPGYLRAILFPTGDGLRGWAADPATPLRHLAVRRARRAFARIR